MKCLSALIIFTASLLFANAAQADHRMIIKIKGEKGIISDKSYTQLNEDGSLKVGIMTRYTRDAASGLPTGKRMHKPFTIIKEIDKSSPLLRQALATKEVLEVEMSEEAIQDTVGDSIFPTLSLQGASVFSIGEPRWILVGKKRIQVEDVSFRYMKIEWDYKTAALDDWRVE